MSAPNFAIPTASRIYAFGMNKYIDQDTIDANNYPQELLGQYDEILSQCDYDDAIANVQSELSAKGWNDIDESDRDRSYPTHYFSRIRHYFTMCGIDFTIIVDAGATSAYYEGANFDYRASLEVHFPDEWYNSEYDLTGSDAVTAAECITDNWTGNQGLSKIHADKIITRIYKELATLTDQAEDAFSEFCEHELLCGGVFSNGEAIYGPAECPRWQMKAAVMAVAA